MKFENIKYKIEKHKATMNPNAMLDLINRVFESWRGTLPGTGGFRLYK
jgi:hypothetical protein